MSEYAECNECDWRGDISELVSKDDDSKIQNFSYCPVCGSSDIEYKEEEDA